MRLDTANRSVLALAAASLISAVWLLCSAAGCVLLALVAYDIARDGPGALVGDDALLPAAVFLALVGTGAILGLRSLARQAAASQRLGCRMDELRLPAPPALHEAAARSGLTGRVLLVDSDDAFSFAYGALSPRVAVSRGLLARASADELDAVLEHERYHVHNLDPLKVVFARGLPAMFFYLPLLQDLHLRYLAGRELAADRRAVEACGRRPLAGALFKVVRGPAWPELSTAAAIGGPELLDLRVAQLERGAEPKLAAVTVRAIVLTALGIAALAASFVATIAFSGGPSAVADATGMGLGAADIALALSCGIPVAAGGWALYRWLSHRARRSHHGEGT
ncbi:MAG: M56 family metallopeptidase [Solirubrobacteraceae bacterium]